MEPAISRIIIFFLTASTHLEPLHRGVRAIVGEFLDDAEPRTAICAVREWISPGENAGAVSDHAQPVLFPLLEN
jgi:hypothetical protein